MKRSRGLVEPKEASLVIFSCDMFYASGEDIWCSPITSSSIRLFGDNFREVGIVAHLSSEGADPAKHARLPRKYHIHSVPYVSGRKGRVGQFLVVLGKIIRLSKEYDFVYLRLLSYESLPAAIWCSLFRRKPWFVSLHGDVEEVYALRRRNCRLPGCRGLSTIMAKLVRFFCVRPRPLFVSGPALGRKYANQREDWVSFMDSGLRAEDVYRERIDSCKSSPCNVICAGDISFRKGGDILLRAIAILRKDGIDVRVSFVGADESGWLGNIIDELGIAEAVDFAGYVPYGKRLFSLMRDADILVVPSRGTEGWNRTITEGNAQGLPIVVSDVNSLGIAVKEWLCGIAVPANDPVSLAGAIRRIIESPSERREMIRNSLKRAEHYLYENEFLRIREALERQFPGRLVAIDEIPVQEAGR